MAQATPFDPHRADDAYLVSGEKRTIPANIGRYRTIIPIFAPFFRTGLEIKNGSTVLKEGKDYYLGHQFMKGSHLSAQMMYGSLYIINPALTGEFTIDYHKVGDDYTVTPAAALQHLVSHQADPTTATWEEVMGERYVPPVDIAYDIDNWKGEAEINASLSTLASTITSRPASDDDFYQVAMAYVNKLAQVIEHGTWKAHLTNKNNPHGDDYISAGALKVDGIAVDTTKISGKTVAELAAMVYAAGVTSTDLASLFPLNGDRSITGPLKLKDGLATIGYKKTNGQRRFAFHLKRSNFEFSAEKSVNVIADAAATNDGATATMQAGNNKLRVISSGASQDSTKLTYNDHQIYTEETIAAAARGAVSTDSRIYTSNSSTLTWSGTGQSSSPLSAAVVWPIASAVQAGIVKLTSRVDLNDSSLGADASTVKALVSRLSSLIPTSRTVGGNALTADVVLDKYDFNLGNVSNLSDANMPVNGNHTALLDNRSTTDHVHYLSEFNYTHATAAITGIFKYSYAVDSAATDVAVPAAVAISQYSAVTGYRNRLVEKVPTNLLDMVQYGGGGYLPIPAVGSYQASGPNNTVMDIATFVHPDGTFVGLRNGADINETGVFYMYGKLKDNALQSLVTTTTRYIPKDTPSGAFVSRAGRASDTALLFAMMDGAVEDLCFAVLGGTMNGARHQWCYADIDTSLFGGRDLVRAFPFIHQNTCYIAFLKIWSPNGALTLSLFQAPLDQVKAGGHVAFARTNLSGFDIHGDARTGNEHVLIYQAMTTVEGGKALILNSTGAGSSNNIFHSSCTSTSFYNDNGVLKMFIGSQGNQWIPAWQTWTSFAWDLDIQLNVSTGTVTNPSGIENTQFTVGPAGVVPGGLYGGGTLASGAGGWDWESSLDVSNGYMVSWRGHWSNGWYISQTVSADGKSISEFFNRGTRSHYRTAEKRVVNSFGSLSRDYLHCIAFAEGDWIYGRNIVDGQMWRCKVEQFGDYKYSPTRIGFGPTTQREAVSGDAFLRQMNHIPYVDGNSVTGLGGIIRTGLLNAKVNQADTIQVSITQAQHDALLSAMRAASGATEQTYEFLTLFIPSDVNMPAVGVYQYCAPNGSNYRSLHQYICEISVSARSGALATVTLGKLINHRQYINNQIHSVNGLEWKSTGSGILKTSDAKLAYLINTVNKTNYVGWTSAFGFGLIYNPATKVWENIFASNHDNEFGPQGALIVPRWGFVRIGTDNSATAIIATSYGYDSANILAGTVIDSSVLLHSSQVTAGWRLYFTEAVNYFVGGTVYTVAPQFLDMQTQFPGAYQNSTFYIYANVVNGVGVYEVSKTKAADTTTRTLVGRCTTGTDRILTLSVDRVTNIFKLRNIIDHTSAQLAHGITEISKNAAGLNLVQNLGMYDALSDLANSPESKYASAYLAMRAGHWAEGVSTTIITVADGATIPLPAGFTSSECMIYVWPWGTNATATGATITSYGVDYDPATLVMSAKAWLSNGTSMPITAAVTIIAAKGLPVHKGS